MCQILCETLDADARPGYRRWSNSWVTAALDKCAWKGTMKRISTTSATLSNSECEKELKALLEFSKPKVS